MKSDRPFGERIVDSALALAAIAVALKLMGFGEKRLLAHLFGTGPVADAYAVAIKIGLAGYFAARGVLRPVLVPMLTTARNGSPAQARGLGAAMALLAAASMGMGCLGAIVFANEVVALFAPGLQGERLQLAVAMTRWFLPGSVAMSLGCLLAVSLQVQKRFAAAAAGECLQKLTWIAGLALLAAPLGAEWMIGAFWLGMAALLAFYGALHARKLRGVRMIELRSAPLAGFVSLGWPLAAGGLVSQMGRMFQMREASALGPGAVAALTQYSQATVDLPLIVLPLALSIVLFAHFSEFSDRRDVERSAACLSCACRFLAIVFVPLAALMWLWREPVAHALWRSGKFGPESVHLTAQALAGLAPGLPLFALESIVTPFFYARRKMIAPMVCGAASTVAAAGLLPFLNAWLGLAGVAAYLPMARLLKLGLLMACLGNLGVAVNWKRSLGILMRVTGATALPAAIWASGSDRLDAGGTGRALMQAGLLAALGALVYCMTLHAFGFDEPRQTWHWLRERAMRAVWRRGEAGNRAQEGSMRVKS